MSRRVAIDSGSPVEWGHPLNRGLVAWWLSLPGRNGALLRDLTGRNHGTLTNGPTWGVGPNGFGAVSFDGSNDYVGIGKRLTDLGLSTAGTVSVWARPTTAGITHAVCGQNVGGGAGDDNDVGTIFALDTNVWWTRWTNSSGTQGTATAGAVLNDTWQHVTSTYDGANVRLYLNGVQTASAALTGAIYPTPGGNEFRLGSRGNYTTIDWYWTGRATDGRVYDRALSASEAGQLYDQSLRGHPDTLRRVGTAYRAFVGGGGGGGGTQPPRTMHQFRMRRAG